MNSGIVRTQTVKEDIFANPFYEYLRQDYEQLIVQSVGREPPGLIVVPSAASLSQSISKPIYTSKKFVESHVLISAHVPGLYSSVRGSPVEYRSDRLILTSEGMKHVSPVTSSESMYDFGHAFKVLVVDKPLFPGIVDNSNPRTASHPQRSGGGPSEYLAAVPLVESDYVEKISKLRRSFLLVPGYESHLAVRIKEMSTIAATQVLRYLPSPIPAVSAVQQDIERATYATLHAWIFSHILSSVQDDKKLFNQNLVKQCGIEAILRESEAPPVLRSNLSVIEASVRADIAPHINKMNISVTPQQKINALVAAQEQIGHLLKSKLQITAPGAEEVLAVLLVAVVVCGYTQAPADVAYALMFLDAHEDLRNSKAAFAVATLNTCVEFLSSATF